MNDERNYKLFLRDMLDSMENIDHYLEGLDYEDFVEDQKAIDAVVRKIVLLSQYYALRNILHLIGCRKYK